MKKKWLLKVFLSLLVLLIVVSAVPYLVHVTTASSDRTAVFPESEYAEIDGILLHYRVWEPEGTAVKGKVLLVHGLGSSTFCWRNNVDALTAEGYLVVAVDLPGFGYSDRKKGMDHSQENRSRLLWLLLDQLDQSMEADAAGDSWNLAGHSMGGGTVTAMALQNPGRTRSIVLVDGAVLINTNFFGFLKYYPPVGRWVEVLGRNVLLKKTRVADFLASAYASTPTDADVEGYLQPLLLDGTEGSFADMMRTSTSISESAFQELAVPVAAIWGDKDSWVPKEEADRLKALLPAMSLDMIPDAGHCCMETHSGLFNQYLIEALDRAAE
jgi:pimeloyl-ACP methyl ester carboxylesterase